MDKSLHFSSHLELLKEKGLTEFNYPKSCTTAMRSNQQVAMFSIFLGKCLHGANDHSSNCYRERLNDIRCSCTSRLDSDLWLRICRMSMKKSCQFLMEQHSNMFLQSKTLLFVVGPYITVYSPKIASKDVQ